jgi:hypothetical protein
MNLVIQLLMVFIFLNTLFKLSFWKLWHSFLFSLVVALFMIVTCQYAVLQSKTAMIDMFNNQIIMQNISVIITIETIIYIMFSFYYLNQLHSNKTKKWVNVLIYYPSLLLFPVLFYWLTSSVFSFSGKDFTLISYIWAISLFFGIPLLVSLVRYILPENEFRLEIHFIVSLFVCIIGLLATFQGDITYTPQSTSYPIIAIEFAIIGAVVVFVIGLVWDKIKWKIFNK